MKKIVNYRLDDFQYPDQVKYYSREVLENVKHMFREETVPNQPFFGVVTSQELFDNILQQLANCFDPELEVFRQKIQQKWINRQGGQAAQSDVEAKLIPYYTNVDSAQQDVVRMSEYSHRFVLLVKAYAPELGIYNVFLPGEVNPIMTNSRALFLTYKGDHKSSRGIDGTGDRRSYGSRIFAIRAAKADPLHLAGAIANFRYKDSKLRIVYNDAFSNYFREAMYLHFILHSIAQLPFVDTYSDEVKASNIASCRAKCAYYADFEGMDFHMMEESDHQMIDDFNEIYSFSDSTLQELHLFIHNLARQEVICGNTLYQGPTAKKSGLYPTHDPENWINATILVGAIDDFWLEEFGCKPTYTFQPRTLKKNQVYFSTNGDDNYVLFGDRLSEDQFHRLIAHHVRVAGYYNQIIEPTKVGFSYDRVEYCKRIFALRPGQRGYINDLDHNGKSYPVSKYSVEKAVNALFHPENIPNFPDKSGLVIWFCSIMDCAYGTKGWKLAVNLIVRSNLELFVNSENLVIDDETRAVLNEDYWFRACNIDWELPKSKTYQLILKIISKLS